MEPEPISVVIPTVDRAAPLVRLLTALRLQTHHPFEVIVVVGPTTDDTVERISALDFPCKVRRCPERNISMARNIGIAAAASDIIAFIDDDAVPEPVWLAELAAGFAHDEIVAVGGLVFDNLGVDLQYGSLLCTRLGQVRHVRDHRPADVRCFPGSWEFPYVPGGNAAYRRAPLLEIGGFDDVFDYYLDETDVCVRLIDAGWVIAPPAGAPIHHKNLPSGVRNQRQVVANWHSIIRNRTYFGCRHARPEVGEHAVLESNIAFRDQCLAVSRDDASAGRMTTDELVRAEESTDGAIDEGVALAMQARRPMPPPEQGVSLLPAPGSGARNHRVVLTVTASALTATPSIGDDIELHIVEPSDDGTSSVELDGAVWRHRVARGGASWQDAARDEVQRIQRYRTVHEVRGIDRL